MIGEFVARHIGRVRLRVRACTRARVGVGRCGGAGACVHLGEWGLACWVSGGAKKGDVANDELRRGLRGGVRAGAQSTAGESLHALTFAIHRPGYVLCARACTWERAMTNLGAAVSRLDRANELCSPTRDHEQAKLQNAIR